MTNQLSKGVVSARTVKAQSVLINGSPALTAATETDATLADLFPDAPVEITTPGGIVAALETLGLAEDSTTTPVEVTGDRDDPESALANLLTALEALGLITDSTVSGA